MESVNWEKRQSVVIDAMRFPLIVLVLFIHVLPEFLEPVQLELSSVSAYTFLSEWFSHTIGRIAVPCFFVFSGFFFFKKMENWSGDFYKLQLKKRARTLVIPYFLWNLLLIIVIILKYNLFSLLPITQSDDLEIFKTSTALDLFWNRPIDFPLWFVRDLICMTVLTPLFYLLLRFGKTYGILFLLALYLLKVETGIPGFSMTAILFFGVGAYFGLNNKNMLVFCNRIKYIAITLSILLSLIATFYNGIEPQYEYIVRLFVPLGVISAINITNVGIDNDKIRNLFLKLSPTVFFVYAIHEFYIKNWLRGFFNRTSLSETGTGMLFIYLAIPLLTLLICLGLYYLWKKASPKTLSILTGGRVEKIRKVNQV